MTLSEQSLARIFNRSTRAAVREAVRQARATKILTGMVDDLNDELDVVMVRLQNEALGSNPAVSDNYGDPGVIYATRLGNTYTGEQVRVEFTGSAGASAMQTSVEKKVILPYGAGDGQRILLDGDEGFIAFFDENNELVGYLDATQWFTGIQGASLARLDPYGGLRLRDENDQLRIQLSSAGGLNIRDPKSGISGLIAGHDGLVVLDPETGERISITSGTTSAVPTPQAQGATTEGSVGSSHATPDGMGFGTGDDLDLRFVVASAAGDLGSPSYTSPSGYTELSDVVDTQAGNTMAMSAAVKQPADTPPAAANFTNTSSDWTRQHGYTVIVRGGGDNSPSIRSTEVSEFFISNEQQFSFEVEAPAGIQEGDLLIANVGLVGDAIPISWTTPEDWKQLNTQVAGLGSNLVQGSGIWYARCPANPPASETIFINMSAPGTTKVQATVVAVQDPYAYPGGLDIRRNNRSMPRGLIAENVSTSDLSSWSNAQLPQAFDEIQNVRVLAGRKYRISFSSVYQFNTFHTDCQAMVVIQLDTGSGYSNWHRVWQRQKSAAGVERDTMYGSRTYVPDTDQTISVRMSAQNITAATGYTLTMFGAGTYRRTLTIEDIGAEF